MLGHVENLVNTVMPLVAIDRNSADKVVNGMVEKETKAAYEATKMAIKEKTSLKDLGLPLFHLEATVKIMEGAIQGMKNAMKEAEEATLSPTGYIVDEKTTDVNANAAPETAKEEAKNK
jgi:DNA-binding LacI/PurR family transcriptional regulator